MTSKESLINTTKLSQPSQDSGPQDSSSESVKESAFSQPATKSGSRSERDEELADSMVDPNHCSPPSNDIHSNKNGSTEAAEETADPDGGSSKNKHSGQRRAQRDLISTHDNIIPVAMRLLMDSRHEFCKQDILPLLKNTFPLKPTNLIRNRKNYTREQCNGNVVEPLKPEDLQGLKELWHCLIASPVKITCWPLNEPREFRPRLPASLLQLSGRTFAPLRSTKAPTKYFPLSHRWNGTQGC